MTNVTPTKNTATPRWAMCMPIQLRGCASKPLRVARIRLKIPITTAVEIHAASAIPNATSADHLPYKKGTPTPATTATKRGRFNCFNTSRSFALFQFATGPTAIRSNAGTIRGTNTRLKYGGPTEILPIPSASIKSGYSVPSRTAPAATDSKTLLTKRSGTREESTDSPHKPVCDARSANKSKHEPPPTAQSISRNAPRRRPVAKAHTHVSAAERTRNAPNNESAKVLIASRTVQF